MKRRCRLCGDAAAPDSIFCTHHLAAAARFSAAFGAKPADTATAMGVAAPEAPAAVAPPAPPLPPPPAVVAAPAELEVALSVAWTAASERLSRADPADVDRWPVLSIYYRGERLLGRAYWGIVPKVPATTPPEPLPPALLHVALAPQGCLFAAVATELDRRREDLRQQKSQTLDLLLAIAAGAVALVVRSPTGKTTNLGAWEMRRGALIAVPAESVRARLQHDWW